MTRSNVPDPGDETPASEDRKTGPDNSDESHQAKPVPEAHRSDSPAPYINIIIGVPVVPGADRTGGHVEADTPLSRLRKRGVVVALAVITSAVVVVLEFLGWTPWN